jgi:hypothetical protein
MNPYTFTALTILHNAYAIYPGIKILSTQIDLLSTLGCLQSTEELTNPLLKDSQYRERVSALQLEMYEKYGSPEQVMRVA